MLLAPALHYDTLPTNGAFGWNQATLVIQLKRARLGTTLIDILTMPDIRSPIVWLAGVLALLLVIFLVRGHFGAEARARRRRERSHRRVISRKQGPTVKLAVSVDKPKRD